MRQPSVLKGERLEKLLDDWAYIKNSSEYKEAIEQSKARTESQAKQKAVLQNLRMQINRLCQKGEDTEDLLQKLGDKEKSYQRGKKRLLGSTTSPRSAHNPMPRAPRTPPPRIYTRCSGRASNLRPRPRCRGRRRVPGKQSPGTRQPCT